LQGGDFRFLFRN